MCLYNSNGEFVRNLTPEEEQVDNAVEKWAERLNQWEYSKQIKRKKGFNPLTFCQMLLV